MPASSLPRFVRFTAFSMLAFFFAGLTGCVSTGQYKELQTAFDQARQQLAEAEHDLAVAHAEIETLKAENARLKDIIDKSAGGNTAISAERDLLVKRLAELQAKYDELLKLAGRPVLAAPINAALRDLAAKYPQLIEFDEAHGMVRFKSDPTFAVGSVEVSAEAKAALAVLARILNMPEIARNEIQVIGHTDDIQVRASSALQSNWHLSTNRAWAVLAVLRADGLSDDRGMASGWGDQRPMAPNAANKQGNPQNRRVEIYILPRTVPEGIVVSTTRPGAAPRPTPRPTPRPSTAPGQAPFIPR